MFKLQGLRWPAARLHDAFRDTPLATAPGAR